MYFNSLFGDGSYPRAEEKKVQDSEGLKVTRRTSNPQAGMSQYRWERRGQRDKRVTDLATAG
ncbi:hypothetical protein N7488_002370 [Penicillium malachiteum]|nr:hypothetical protein N7488_002370 [Penicillium malachiteum]